MKTGISNPRFRSGRSTNGLLGDFGPGQVASQPRLDGGVKPTEVDKSLDKLREALVPQSPTDHRLGFGYVVPFPERDRVTVGIGNKRVGGRDEIGFSDAHQLAARNVELLSARDV